MTDQSDGVRDAIRQIYESQAKAMRDDPMFRREPAITGAKYQRQAIEMAKPLVDILVKAEMMKPRQYIVMEKDCTP